MNRRPWRKLLIAWGLARVALAGRPSPDSVRFRLRCEHVHAVRLEVEDIATIVLLTGDRRRQFEGQAEREGSPYVVKRGAGAVRCGWHPDLRRYPIGGIRLGAATIERPPDPHGERRLHCHHGVPQRRHSRYLGESRVVVGAVRVLAEAHGSAWVVLLVDQQPRVDRRIRR